VDVGLTLTAFGGMIAIFGGITKMMLTQASKDRMDDRLERHEGIKASKNMAKAFTRVAVATERSAEEAKTRNGHLGEQTLEIAKQNTKVVELVGQIIEGQKTAAKVLVKGDKEVAGHVEDKRIIDEEDRDVLTNQNKHIATEVDKRMDEKQ